MTYETLFDTAEISFSYGTSAALIVLGVIAIAWAGRAIIRLVEGQTSFLPAFKAFLAGMVGFGLFYMVGKDWWNFQNLQAAAASDGVSHIEGVVQDHWVKEQTRDTGSKIKIVTVEHFRLRHTVFEFVHDRGNGVYFANSGDHATELSNGLRLRIAFIEDGDTNRIVKLEIAR